MTLKLVERQRRRIAALLLDAGEPLGAQRSSSLGSNAGSRNTWLPA
jgi:hypothetical protein